MNNYQFCTQWVLEQQGSQTMRVLDDGCGVGEIVNLLRADQGEVAGRGYG